MATPGGDSVVLEEEIDPDYEPTENEVVEYAKWLGMDMEEDKDLVWIAREGLKAPLPDNWKPCKTLDTLEIYYFNFASGDSTWDHPCDAYYRNLYEEEKKRRVMRSQTGSSVRDDGRAKKKEQKAVKEITRQQKGLDLSEDEKRHLNQVKRNSFNVDPTEGRKPFFSGGSTHSLTNRNPLPGIRPTSAPKDTPRNVVESLSKRQGRASSVEDSYESNSSRNDRRSKPRNKKVESEEEDFEEEKNVFDTTGLRMAHDDEIQEMQKEFEQNMENQEKRLNRLYQKEHDEMVEQHEQMLNQQKDHFDTKFEGRRRQNDEELVKLESELNAEYETVKDELRRENEIRIQKLEGELLKEEEEAESRLECFKRDSDQIEDLRETQKDLNSTIRNLESQRENLERGNNELLQQQKSNRLDFENNLKREKSTLQSLESKGDILKGRVRELTTEKENIDKQKEQLEQSVVDKHSILRDLDFKIRDQNSALVSLEESIKNSEVAHKQRMELAKNSLEERKAKNEETLSELETRQLAKSAQIESMEAQRFELRKEIEDLRTAKSSKEMVVNKLSIEQVRQEEREILQRSHLSELERLNQEIGLLQMSLRQEKEKSSGLDYQLGRIRQEQMEEAEEAVAKGIADKKLLNFERSSRTSLEDRIGALNVQLVESKERYGTKLNELENIRNTLELKISSLQASQLLMVQGKDDESSIQMVDLNSKIQELRGKINDKEDRIRELQVEVQKYSMRNQELLTMQDSDGMEKHKEINERLQETERLYAQAVLDLDQARKDDTQQTSLDHKLAQKSRELTQLNERLRQLNSSNQENSDLVVLLRSEIEILKSEKNAVELSKVENDESIDRMLSRFHTEIDHANAHKLETEESLNALKRTHSNLKIMYEQRGSDVERADETVARHKDEIRNLQNLLHAAQRERIQVDNPSPRFERSLERLKQEKDELEEELRLSQSQEITSGQEIGRLKREHHALTREKVKLEEELGQFQSQEIISEKEIGRLKREHHTLMREKASTDEYWKNETHLLQLDLDTRTSQLEDAQRNQETLQHRLQELKNDDQLLGLKAKERKLGLEKTELEHHIKELKSKVQDLESKVRDFDEIVPQVMNNMEEADSRVVRKVRTWVNHDFVREKSILETTKTLIDSQIRELQDQKQRLLDETMKTSRSSNSKVAVQISSFLQSQTSRIDSGILELQDRDEGIMVMIDTISSLYSVALELLRDPSNVDLLERYEHQFSIYNRSNFYDHTESVSSDSNDFENESIRHNRQRPYYYQPYFASGYPPPFVYMNDPYAPPPQIPVPRQTRPPLQNLYNDRVANGYTQPSNTRNQLYVPPRTEDPMDRADLHVNRSFADTNTYARAQSDWLMNLSRELPTIAAKVERRPTAAQYSLKTKHKSSRRRKTAN